MECRFSFDQDTVHPLQRGILRERERIVLGCTDDVVGVTAGTAKGGDSVTRHAGDTRVCGLMLLVVELWIVKGAGEERNWVMASGTEACSSDITVAFEGDLARVANGE